MCSGDWLLILTGSSVATLLFLFCYLKRVVSMAVEELGCHIGHDLGVWNALKVTHIDRTANEHPRTNQSSDTLHLYFFSPSLRPSNNSARP